MTVQEKKDIYMLLKTAKSWTYGYKAPDFCGEMPVFTDDIVPQDKVTTADTTTQPAQSSMTKTHSLSQKEQSQSQQQSIHAGISLDSIKIKIESCC